MGKLNLPATSEKGDISFKNVKFGYTKNKTIIKNDGSLLPVLWSEEL